MCVCVCVCCPCSVIDNILDFLNNTLGKDKYYFSLDLNIKTAVLLNR